MDVLLTVHQFFPHYTAGTEVLTLSVARELTRRGHQVRVLTGHPATASLRDDERMDEYEFEGIHVYRFHHAYTQMAGQISMIEVGYDNRLAAQHFAKIASQFQPDLVHFFHLNRLGTGLIEQAALLGLRRYMTPTDFWAICPTAQLLLPNGSVCAGPSPSAGNCIRHFAQTTQSGPMATIATLVPVLATELLSRLTTAGLLGAYPKRHEVVAMAGRLDTNVGRLNLLDKLVVPNAFMHDLMLRHGVDLERLVELSYGIDIAPYGGPAARDAVDGAVCFGFIGTLAPHKGCHVLIEAFQDLPAGSAILRIYGSEDDFPEYAQRLRKLARGNNAIEFCGTFANSRISEILAGFAALVVPSLWYENTPLVVYSAQAARVPVVASDLPGISSVIESGLNGLLFQPGDSATLGGQLARLVHDANLRSHLAAHAKPPKSTETYVDELLEVWAGEHGQLSSH